MQITTELKENITKWCTALRSGDYTQTRCALQNQQGFCCLGVACKVFIPDEQQRLSHNQYISGASPRQQTHAPNWLKNIESTINKLSGGASLIALNDGMSLTFDEIADVLEAIVIHEVLK